MWKVAATPSSIKKVAKWAPEVIPPKRMPSIKPTSKPRPTEKKTQKDATGRDLMAIFFELPIYSIGS